MASRPTQTIPVQPTTATAPTTYDPAYPPQLGVPGGPGQDDAPPSYEDAMADELAPADGPRPAYSGVTDVNAIGIDEKGGSSARQGDAKGSGGMGGRSTIV
jgi:hypothetical protein